MDTGLVAWLAIIGAAIVLLGSGFKSGVVRHVPELRSDRLISASIRAMFARSAEAWKLIAVAFPFFWLQTFLTLTGAPIRAALAAALLAQSLFAYYGFRLFLIDAPVFKSTTSTTRQFGSIALRVFFVGMSFLVVFGVPVTLASNHSFGWTPGALPAAAIAAAGLVTIVLMAPLAFLFPPVVLGKYTWVRTAYREAWPMNLPVFVAVALTTTVQMLLQGVNVSLSTGLMTPQSGAGAAFSATNIVFSTLSAGLTCVFGLIAIGCVSTAYTFAGRLHGEEPISPETFT